ncbi:efflux RND transporter periplasmic adaptor subunit [Marinobacter sp.]|uniref:efflux RND transporter periplasmic adaptor subunit n=1 Tax=Marinobacter sp. TaxID=50741 RepID=UPI003A90AE3C
MALRQFSNRKLLALVGFVGGILLIVLLVFLRERPAHNESNTAPMPLTVIEVQPMPFVLTARGFGITRPVQTWQAVANVAGRVVERHPELNSGTLLPAGALLIALDPGRYQLAIAETEAELASLAAEQAQLDAETQNTRQLLQLESERLELSEGELGRIERLLKTGAVSRSRLDEQRRATLSQRQLVQSLENQLSLLPSKQQYLDAQIQRAHTRLEQGRQDLEDTRFIAPYDLRIRTVDVEEHQYAALGQPLFLADGIEQAEVEAQVPLSMLRRLMTAVSRPVDSQSGALDITERFDFSAIRSEVELTGFPSVRWPASVSRVASGLDPGTRSGRVIVTVEKPYSLASVPERPAFQRDMHVQVRFFAPSPRPLLAVPASAVHQGEVYLLGNDNLLQRRPVVVVFEQNGLAVIESGLATGELLITDDPVPAIAGMKVVPHRDAVLEQHLQQLALGAAQ